MGLNHFNIDQALVYFNKNSGVTINHKTFLIYCVEHNIPIKYKAITTFKVCVGILISKDELLHLIEYRKNIGNSNNSIENIFNERSFADSYTRLAYKYIDKYLKLEYEGCDATAKIKALMLAYEKVKETEDFVKLQEKKEYLYRLDLIKNAYKVIQNIDGLSLAFNTSHYTTLEPGIYSFNSVDGKISEIAIKNLISNSIYDYETKIPDNCNLIIAKGNFYHRPLDYEMESSEEFFQQIILKEDVDLLIKRLVQKNKPAKEADILHPRTANNASKIIGALCELNGLDITQPYGGTNKEIMSVLDRLGIPLSKEVIGDWLKLAHENAK